MAIKGKRKSQGRGRGTRRRPSAAPPPRVAARAHVPWHRKPGGRVAAAIAVVLIVALIGGVIAAVTQEDPAAVAARDVLENYTNQIRAFTEQVEGPATAMAAAPQTPDQEGFDTLADDAQAWMQELEMAQLALAQQQPPDEARRAGEVFGHAVSLYVSAARTFSSAPRASGRLRARILQSAAEQRDHATALWASGTGIIDDARAEVDLAPSGLRLPAEAGPPQPQELPNPENGVGGDGGEGDVEE